MNVEKWLYTIFENYLDIKVIMGPFLKNEDFELLKTIVRFLKLFYVIVKGDAVHQIIPASTK